MVEILKSGSLMENTYVFSNNNKCVVIDPGMDFLSNYEYIKSKYEIEAVLLTHGHIDHIDGIRYFDCPIYILKEEKEFLFDKSLSLYNMFNSKIPFDANKLDIRYLNDGDILNLVSREFRVIKTSGHTIGSCCYMVGNVMFTGDTIFALSVGRTDFPTGNEKELQKSLIKILDNYNDSVILYPGHDDKTTIKKEKKENSFYLYAKKIRK